MMLVGDEKGFRFLACTCHSVGLAWIDVRLAAMVLRYMGTVSAELQLLNGRIEAMSNASASYNLVRNLQNRDESRPECRYGDGIISAAGRELNDSSRTKLIEASLCPPNTVPSRQICPSARSHTSTISG